MRKWDVVGVGIHGRVQILRLWDDTDVQGHGYVSTWEDTGV